MDKKLFLDVWHNPRNFGELVVSALLYLNKTPLLGNNLFFLPLLVFKLLFIWIPVYIPIFFANLAFFFLPHFPSKNPNDKKFCDSAIHILPLAITCFAITLFFSYGVVLYLTETAGDAPSTRGFSLYSFQEDWANQWLYLIVVPVYVTLSIMILVTSRSFQNLDSMRQPNNSDNDKSLDAKIIDGTRPKFMQQGIWQMSLIIVAVLYAGFEVTAGYQNDVYNLLLCEGDKCNKTEAPLLYWFLTDKTLGVTYNKAGLYYILLNYWLLIIVIFSVMFYYFCAFSVAGLMKHINEGLYDDFDILYKDLRGYRLLYVYAKWLSLALIVNTFIWRESYLGDVQNLDITIVMYGILASFLLPIPNHIVQTTWNLRQRKRYLDGKIDERVQACTIFTRGWIYVAKNIANFFIGFFFAFSLIIVLQALFGIDTFFSIADIIERVKKLSISQ